MQIEEHSASFNVEKDLATNSVEQNNYNIDIEDEEQQEQLPTGDEEESESVYMIDGVVMRMIQIEGEDQQYLMDPQGRIYDMQANFIGTANTQGLEEMENAAQKVPDEPETDEDPQFYDDQQHY